MADFTKPTSLNSLAFNKNQENNESIISDFETQKEMFTVDPIASNGLRDCKFLKYIFVFIINFYKLFKVFQLAVIAQNILVKRC